MSHVTELDMYLFGEGTHYDIYEKMGAHAGQKTVSKAFILMFGPLMHNPFM